MRVSLLTDAPKHNLALMKLSSWHKAQGDTVALNMPLFPADHTYASVLFEKNRKAFIADEYGGPAYVCTGERTSLSVRNQLSRDVEISKPDYDLYGQDYSLGYTYRKCRRGCDFCKVGSMVHPDVEHHSIWEFHNPKFTKICILNNNTFMDLQWRETFEEIRDAGLSVIDENGYDLRLLDDEKAEALKRTKFEGKIHFAWDRMRDEKEIVSGLKTLRKYKMAGHIYVLCGYDTTEEEDIHRCQVLIDHKQDPYIMPFTENVRPFKRFIDTFMWRKYKTIAEAWKDYTG